MHSRLKGLLAAIGVAATLTIGPAMTRPAAASDTVVVRSGDTLSDIAAKSGVTVEQLVAMNGIRDANRIYAGQTLRLKAAPASAAPKAATTKRTHAVRFGETLTAIARRYGTTVQAIVSMNHLPSANRIYAGQQLVVGQSGPAAPAKPPAKPAAAPAQAPAAARTHTVRPGETLTAIARHYATTIAAIVATNGIANPSFVRAGTVLRIPATATHSTPAPATAMPASMGALVAKRSGIRAVIVGEARRFGVSPSFALAVAWQESGWQQGVTSHAGAIGVMQLLPATGDWVGGAMLGNAVNLRDTRHNVRAGVRLLRHYLDRYHGDRALALAAYYQGQTAADRHGIYPVSRPYIASILRLEQFFR